MMKFTCIENLVWVSLIQANKISNDSQCSIPLYHEEKCMISCENFEGVLELGFSEKCQFEANKV